LFQLNSVLVLFFSFLFLRLFLSVCCSTLIILLHLSVILLSFFALRRYYVLVRALTYWPVSRSSGNPGRIDSLPVLYFDRFPTSPPSRLLAFYRLRALLLASSVFKFALNTGMAPVPSCSLYFFFPVRLHSRFFSPFQRNMVFAFPCLQAIAVLLLVACPFGYSFRN